MTLPTAWKSLLRMPSFARTLSGLVLAFFAAVAWSQSAPPLLTVSMAFTPSAVGYGESSTLSVTVTNTSTFQSVSQVSASPVSVPSVLSINTPVTTPQCSTFAVALVGGGFEFSGGTLSPSQSCTINVGVTVIGSPEEGGYSASLEEVTYNFGGADFNTDGGANATLVITGGASPTITSDPPFSAEEGEDYDFQVTATGTPPITFSSTGLPPGLTINGTTGEITGTPTVAGSYSPSIFATNAFPPPARQSFDMDVFLPPLSVTKSFSPATIPTGGTSTMSIVLVNNEVEETLGGIGFADPFPAGMTAVPGTSNQCGGVVTLTTNSLSFTDGSVASRATCIVSVQVTGRASRSTPLTNTTGTIFFGGEGSRDGVSGTLNIVAQAPKITSGLPPGGVVGMPYFFSITTTGTAPITLAVTGLPPGLVFTPGTHSIGGTPTTVGKYPGSITASNGIPPNATQSYSIGIASPPLAITTKTLPPIGGGGMVSVPIQAVGGIPPYTFVVQSGQVPPGLTLSPAGLLSGNPTTPGTFNFTVQVTDSIGTKAIQPYSVTISQVSPAFGFEVTPDPAVAGQPVVISATLTGGSGAASGELQVWVAHSNERCPQTPGTAPIAPLTSTAALNGSGQAQFSFPNLPIDNYEVCGAYAGNGIYAAATAGPIDLFVIKGTILAAPAVTIVAPSSVKIGTALPAQVTVTPPPTLTRVPGGSVVLRANGVAVGTVALSGGAAVFTTTAPSVPGRVILTASYYGDGAYAPAVSAARAVAVDRQAEVDAVPVPTLSEIALALLLAAIAFVGAQALMRRRAGR
jgi:hypothetical protein